MDRNTNLREMNAPAPNSGVEASETVLGGTAKSTPAEKASNELTEKTFGPQPKKNLGGENSFS